MDLIDRSIIKSSSRKRKYVLDVLQTLIFSYFNRKISVFYPSYWESFASYGNDKKS